MTPSSPAFDISANRSEKPNFVLRDAFILKLTNHYSIFPAFRSTRVENFGDGFRESSQRATEVGFDGRDFDITALRPNEG